METVFTTQDWIMNKKIFPVMRLFLNSIFCVSIATFVYSHCYQEQTTVLKDAQLNLMRWFVDGNFFLPIVMVIFIWLGTWICGALIWYTFNWLLPRKFVKQIEAFEIGRQDIVLGFWELRRNLKKYASIHLTQNDIGQFYIQLKDTLTESELNELQQIFKKQEAEIQATVYMLLRLVFAMTIYCYWLPYFSVWLYVVLLAVVLAILFFMLMSGLLFTILPDIAKKFDQIAQQFFANQLPKRILN